MEPLRIRDALRIGALLVVLGHPRLAGAAASKASDLCPVTADPCVVTADVTVDPDTVLDFGGRALDLRPGSSLSFASGTLTIRARSVRVEPAASILGSAPISSFPTLSIVTTGDIRVEASGTTKGKIDVSGSDAGNYRSDIVRIHDLPRHADRHLGSFDRQRHRLLDAPLLHRYLVCNREQYRKLADTHRHVGRKAQGKLVNR